MTLNTQSFGERTQAHSDSIDQRDTGSLTHPRDTVISQKEIRNHLEGLRFPTTKVELLAFADQQNVPRHIVHLWQRLPAPELDGAKATPPRQYQDMDALLQEIDRLGQTQ